MKHRTSPIQKETLKALVFFLVRSGIKEVKSTDMNAVINKKLSDFIHPNNFRTSMKTLESRGLIHRYKKSLDWYIAVTEDGFDLGYSWLS